MSAWTSSKGSNYTENPIGSRDWTLFWAGWLARSTHRFDDTEKPADTRKPCTCDGAGRGPGRACVVKAGGRLGDLWRCANGLEAPPAAERPCCQVRGFLSGGLCRHGIVGGEFCGFDGACDHKVAQPKKSKAQG